MLLPFTHAVVPTVDLARGVIVADPPAEVEGAEVGGPGGEGQP
jgi:ribosomal 30S subunit maturation factor RimM